MRSAKIILFILGILSVCTLTTRISSQTPARDKRIVIAASTVLDGRGRVLRDTRIAIEGARIAALDPKVGPWSQSHEYPSACVSGGKRRRG